MNCVCYELLFAHMQYGNHCIIDNSLKNDLCIETSSSVEADLIPCIAERATLYNRIYAAYIIKQCIRLYAW